MEEPVAFALIGPDNGSFMYGGDTDPPNCDSCGLITEPAWVDPSFTLANQAFDYSYTYDGAAIVSEPFKEVAGSFEGARFEQLPLEPGFFLMVIDRRVRFDAVRRKTRFDQACRVCGRHYVVAGAHPVFLLDAVPNGFSRTDLEFGTGREQHPVHLVDRRTAQVLGAEGFAGLELRAIAS